MAAVSNTELMRRLKTAKGAQRKAIQTSLRARASFTTNKATKSALLGAARGGKGGGGGRQRRDSHGRFA